MICGAVIQMNIEEYLKFPTMPNQLEFFKTLGRVGSILSSSLNIEKDEKLLSSYGLYAVIDP